MAAINTAWDYTTPADTENISSGDDAIRTFKLSLMERVGNGGHAVQLYSGSPTTVTTDGRHCAGAALTAGASELAGEFIIYAADKTTAVATFRDSTAATPSELYLGANGLRATLGTFTGAVATGAVTATGHVKPTTDNLYDLGDLTHRWKNAWFSGAVLFDGAVTFTLAVTHSAAETFSAQHTLASSSFLARQDVTSGTTALGANSLVVLGKLTADATVTLPAAASNAGRIFYIAIASSTSSAHTLTINPNASELIHDALTLELFPFGYGLSSYYYAVQIICDGSNWHILSGIYVT